GSDPGGRRQGNREIASGPTDGSTTGGRVTSDLGDLDLAGTSNQDVTAPATSPAASESPGRDSSTGGTGAGGSGAGVGTQINTSSGGAGGTAAVGGSGGSGGG